MGSNKLVSVIMNEWLYSYEGSLNSLIIEANLSVSRIVTGYVWMAVDARLYDHLIDHNLCVYERHAKLAYLDAVLFIVDVCEHTRDMIDYVRTSTNELYAKRLDGFLVQIDKLLADLNPTKHLFAMKWHMKDFHKIPQRILEGWLAAE